MDKTEKIERRLLTAAEVAEYLGVTEYRIAMLAKAGDIPRVRLGSEPRPTFRYDLEDIDAWVDARKELGR